jgi:hypothetical protein
MENTMKHETLKGCIEGLKRLRTSKHRTLDVSVIAELDAVIFQLEQSLGSGDDVKIDSGLSARVLEVLSRSLELATNLSEIIKWFISSE